MTLNLNLAPPTFKIDHDFGSHLLIKVPAAMTVGEFRDKSIEYTNDIDRVCHFDLGWITITIRPGWTVDDLLRAYYERMKFEVTVKKEITEQNIAGHIIHVSDEQRALAHILNAMAEEYRQMDFGVMASDMEDMAKHLTPDGIELVRAIDRNALLPTEKPNA